MKRKSVSFACFAILCLMLQVSSQVAWAGSSSKGGSSPSEPTFYTYEDLVNFLKTDVTNINCDKSIRPPDALADLPESPVSDVTYARMKANSAATNPHFQFNWNEIPNFEKGLLVFQRSDSWVGRCEQFFSSFTHVSIIYDWKNKTVFESLRFTDKDGKLYDGVGVYPSDKTWNEICTLSIKKVNNVNDAGYWTDLANKQYAGLPYFPKVSSLVQLDGFYTRWADKWNLESMYCSKLVWRTFKDAGVDLDSNATCSWTHNNFGYNNNEPGYGWIGVSPDDIYYSQYLGPDLFLRGADQLRSPVYPLI